MVHLEGHLVVAGRVRHVQEGPASEQRQDRIRVKQVAERAVRHLVRHDVLLCPRCVPGGTETTSRQGLREDTC